MPRSATRRLRWCPSPVSPPHGCTWITRGRAGSPTTCPAFANMRSGWRPSGPPSCGRLGHHAQVTDEPAWWRGEKPTEAPRVDAGVITGDVSAITYPSANPLTGQASLYFFRAALRNTELSLDDVHLVVEWSEFHECRFRQFVKPILNELGFAAQGTFGSSPAIYRGCTF